MMKNYNELIKKIGNQFITSYTILDKKICVLTNLHKKYFLKNKRTNINKIEKQIKKDTEKIEGIILDYNDTYFDKLFILLFNVFLICISGSFTVMAFFIGSIILFVSSCVLFSVLVLITSTFSYKFYLKTRKIIKYKKLINIIDIDYQLIGKKLKRSI